MGLMGKIEFYIRNYIHTNIRRNANDCDDANACRDAINRVSTTGVGGVTDV